MIVEPNITTYLYSIEPDGPEDLEQLRSYALSRGVPIIRREMEPFLKVLLKSSCPGTILEIGTGIGYSALFMNRIVPKARITTIENYEPRLEEARKVLHPEPNIELLEGDGVQILTRLTGPYDLIFLDSAKGQYLTMLPDLIRVLSEGGILLADNVLQDGELVKSRYLIPRRQRTIHSRMRQFVWEVKHHPELDSALLTVGDGVMLCRKKGKEER
ncbi:MAG: O-methyltransferase [Parasporobacterium sp.]|nr:O-methyltransferase [Parasporobacterium sp.]